MFIQHNSWTRFLWITTQVANNDPRAPPAPITPAPPALPAPAPRIVEFSAEDLAEQEHLEQREQRARRRRLRRGDDLVEVAEDELGAEQANGLQLPPPPAPAQAPTPVSVDSGEGSEPDGMLTLEQQFPRLWARAMEGPVELPPAAPVINPENNAEPEREKPFRFRGKKISLTYPRCYVTKEQLMDALRTYFGTKLEWIAIAQEQHRDGTPHLHVAISLLADPDIRNCHALDLPGREPEPDDENQSNMYHPNIQKTKNPCSWLRYIAKSDSNVLCWNLDILKKIYELSGTLDKIATKAYDGDPGWEQEVRKMWPGQYMMHKARILDMAACGNRDREPPPRKGWLKIYLKKQYWRDSKMIDLVKYPEKYKEHLPMWHMIPLGGVVPREHRQAQAYIHGPKKTGKTSLLRALDANGFRRYIMPRRQSTFYDGMQHKNYYSLCTLDEFKGGQYDPTDLNTLLDGDKFKFECKKQEGEFIRDENLTFIIFSNFPPWDERVYGDPDKDESVAAFIERVSWLLIDSSKYDLFNAELLDENDQVIPRAKTHALHYCSLCGVNKNAQKRCRCAPLDGAAALMEAQRRQQGLAPTTTIHAIDPEFQAAVARQFTREPDPPAAPPASEPAPTPAPAAAAAPSMM